MVRYFFTRTARMPGFEVEHNQFLRTARTVLVSVRYRGFIQAVFGVIAAISFKLKFPIMQRHGFAKQGARYDWLDTDGIVEVQNLNISKEKYDTTCRYEAASEYEFRDVLERLKISCKKYHFLDYGSGKGAILAAAATYPFESVVGVEHSLMLHEIATENITEMKRRNSVVANVLYSVHGDATTYELPAEPHIIYLFNSFGADILKDVTDRITRDLADVHEPIFFLYNNPMHHAVLDANDKFHKISSPFGGKWMVYSVNP